MTTCKNHPNKKVHSKGLCKNCYDKELKKNNPEFKKRQYESHKKWEEKNKDRIKEYQKKRRLTQKERDNKVKFERNLKIKYNITTKEYNEIVEKSNNSCYICGAKPYNNRKLHLDHNHITGKVRGLLCPRCNWYLAVIEKDPSILEKIKKYLEYE